VKTDKYQ